MRWYIIESYDFKRYTDIPLMRLQETSSICSKKVCSRSEEKNGRPLVPIWPMYFTNIAMSLVATVTASGTM